MPTSLKTSFSTAFVLSLFLLVHVASPTADASLSALSKVYLTRTSDGGGALGGGAFDLYLYDDNGASGDQLLGTTFCIEFNEHIQLGRSSWMYVGSITDQAIMGGRGGGSPDPLGVETDFLYRAFSNGTLSGFDLLGDGSLFFQEDAAWYNALQMAIWVREEEQDLSMLNSDARARALYDYASNNATTFSGEVFALNLFKQNTDFAYLRDTYDPNNVSTWGPNSDLANQHRQDQLFYNPSQGPTATPEPATMVIWGALGLIGCGARYRKKRQLARSAGGK